MNGGNEAEVDRSATSANLLTCPWWFIGRIPSEGLEWTGVSLLLPQTRPKLVFFSQALRSRLRLCPDCT